MSGVCITTHCPDSYKGIKCFSKMYVDNRYLGEIDVPIRQLEGFADGFFEQIQRLCTDGNGKQFLSYGMDGGIDVL